MKKISHFLSLVFWAIFVATGCYTTQNTATPSNQSTSRASSSIKYYVDADKDGTFEAIELAAPPEPTQGKEQWGRDFSRYITYPASARNNSIEGVVVLLATVDPFGSLQEVIVQQSLSPDCDAVAKRAYLNATSQLGYSPLKLNGAAVPFKVEIPVNFNL